MMTYSRPARLIAAATLIIAAVSQCIAAEPRRPTGKKWIDMDYGSTMTHSFQASRPAGNIAYKGIKIRLGDDGQAMLFDTDLLRYAAGWQASQLDWKSVVYDGSHNTHPSVLGEPVFANPILPGWAKGEKFDDPRALPYGPLPREWAHWKGHYKHGERVVLSYTVGDAAVLESPALIKANGVTALARQIQIGSSKEDLLLQVAFDADGQVRLLSQSDLKTTESTDVSQSIALTRAPARPSLAGPMRETSSGNPPPSITCGCASRPRPRLAA